MNKQEQSYNLLKGKTGIVFGPLDESSIGWKIALAAYREGAKLIISNIAVAQRIGQVDELCKLCGDAPLMLCDATNVPDLQKGFKEMKEKVGNIDFMVHSVGMSQNIRKDIPYDDINYDFFMKTLDVSAVSLHKIITAALKENILNEGASIVALTYIASVRNFWHYSDMGDAKSLLESIIRSYGPRLARKGIRINTVSQSPTYTKAGSGIEDFDLMFNYSNLISPLGNASAEDCADYVVTLLSDLTRKITMQNLFNDGGYSYMGATHPMLKIFQKALENPEYTKDMHFKDFYNPEFHNEDPIKNIQEKKAKKQITKD